MTNTSIRMPNEVSKTKLIIRSVRYGGLTILFSYLPSILVFFINWAKDHSRPLFESVFDSGGMISIWIPILVMLILSLYEVKGKHRVNPNWEYIIYISVIISAIVSIAFYPVFYFGVVKYGIWVKWMVFVVVCLLFCALCFYRYLEYAVVDDLPSSRTREQDYLNNKLNNIN